MVDIIKTEITNDDVWDRLDWRRLLAAFAIAPLVPALLVSTPSLFDEGGLSSYVRWVALFALVGGYPAALLFGLPALLVLKRWLRPRLVWAVLAGGLVAAAPWSLVMLIPDQLESASVGGQVTVHNGQRTLFGWISALQVLGFAFALGTIGGMVFWLVGVCRFKARPASTSRST